MKPTLRKFTSEDTPVLLKLFYETVHAINAKDYSQDLLNAWAPEMPNVKKWQSRFKAAKTVVAELDGKIVGFGNIEQGAIGMLYVHKDHQRQQVASALLNKLEKRLTKKGTRIAAAEVSITAKPFFEKKGYSVVRENQKTLNGQTFLNYVMEKTLPLKTEKPMKEKQKGTDGFRWRDLFINKVFDLMIVIAGVSIAFQLNNLKLDSDAKSLEKFYIEGLAADLRRDMEEMQGNIVELKADLKYAEVIRTQLSLPETTVPADSIAKGFFNMVSFDTFNKHNNTYEMIVNGNGLSVISDRNMRTVVSEYYGGYSAIYRFESVYTEVILRSFTYLINYIDFSTQRVIDVTVLKRNETKNFTLIWESQIRDGIGHYEDSLKEAELLLQMLENNLRK